MRLVFFDCETFFDSKNDYTLKKMTTEEYIRDPRFEMSCAGIKWAPHEATQFYDQREVAYILKEEDWSDVFLVSHHAQFDLLILSHHFDVHPKRAGCTMSMARLMLGNHIGVSLDSVRAQFGLPSKITPYHAMDGRHWSDMDQNTRDQMAAGVIDEVDSKVVIFRTLMERGFPPEELEIVDTTIKMFTEPTLRGDTDILARVWQDEFVKKQNLLQRLGVTEQQLQSADEFARLLQERGVEPQMKPGKPNADGSPKPIYAFAKTDPFMENLLGDEDEEIRALAEARLGIKSTLLQTRAETVGFMAQRGLICVYLRYAGAHTSRWSGGDGSNFQNWTNGSLINQSLIAPDGWLIVEPDASQIECRLLNFIARQDDKIDEFREGRDPYISVASEFYGFPVNKKDHPDERQLGKIVELQAGYMSGGEKIRATVRIKSGGKLLLTSEEGKKARDSYRSTHPQVVQLWRDADMVLKRMLNWLSFDWGPMRVQCNVEAGTRRIILPNGIQLNYDTLELYVDSESGDKYFRLKTRKGWEKTYSGKLVENVIQALARVVVSQAMIRLKHRGFRIIMTKHDSIWMLVRDDEHLEENKRIIIEEMSREPDWLPGIPLAAEFKHIGARYG